MSHARPFHVRFRRGFRRIEGALGPRRLQRNAFAPANGTYPGVSGIRARLRTIQDSGRAGTTKAPLANLYPLIAGELYEVGFAREAGPLATLRN